MDKFSLIVSLIASCEDDVVVFWWWF